MSLQGKVALVTGATRGIGRAIALSLGEQGATVIGTATSEKGAATISEYLQAAGIQGKGLVLNVTQENAIDETVTAIEAEFAAPDILVNNAGITRDNLLMRMKDEEWDDIIDTNLTPIFKLSKRCVRAMTKARWGRIINITSVVGVMGNAGQTNYAAAKAGVIGFSKSLAREVGARGITVNSVAPGFIDTDMTSGLPEAHKTALLEQVPVKRLGEAEEIAAAVSFLASPLAGYITGETLHVNGGMYMN
ncbi:3-oxoacyl-ACP reductase FabG [Methylophaga nitratireducenticrescens]|uniref:3-oxoacyl-[acyl-carrier-protein] reductase n=1 Tax=Methylophaga nitratireducenticrescens TaxID=754476 RepID=I1XKB2_METNJ|nr:3-oxoacyl-ACP reductase FabG [Methylophaga nitratireducenticrescens]AFI84831.1 beta-ketoacyl-ACP reductase [Methylophaga nitratireducenticrescens]AUZ84851.1 beta-ketoacyl-ACP reductase [Methylophaga nitratireducenticrescens]